MSRQVIDRWTDDVTKIFMYIQVGPVLFFLVGSKKKTKLSLGIEVGASDSIVFDKPHGCIRLNLI